MYEWGANSWDFPEDNVDGSIKVLLAPRADVDSIEPMESPDIRYDYIIFSPKSPGSARNFLFLVSTSTDKQQWRICRAG